MQKRLDALPDSRARLLGWIDEVLSLGYDRARAKRTRTFVNEASRLRSAYAAEFVGIHRAVYEPLIRVLEAGRADGTFPGTDPEEDARSIHAVTWTLIEAHLGGGGLPDLARARAHVLRFCLPALGMGADVDDSNERTHERADSAA